MDHEGIISSSQELIDKAFLFLNLVQKCQFSFIQGSSIALLRSTQGPYFVVLEPSFVSDQIPEPRKGVEILYKVLFEEGLKSVKKLQPLYST